jgi:hypothetical protein
MKKLLKELQEWYLWLVAELMSKNILDSTCADADAGVSECACRETWSEGERERTAWKQDMASVPHAAQTSWSMGGLRDSPDNDYMCWSAISVLMPSP